MNEWIDLQVNGYGGVDFNAPGLTVEAVRTVTERLAADGTVGYLPTLVTGNPETVLANIRTIAAARRADPECRDRILGVHLEGPYFNAEKCGAQDTANIRRADLDECRQFLDAGVVKRISIAPEFPENLAAGDFFHAAGVSVSAGHTMIWPSRLTTMLNADG